MKERSTVDGQPSATENDTPAPRTATGDAEEPAAGDPVDAWGVQSFPASDPPSWWAGAPD
jgi:hypothetical protein